VTYHIRTDGKLNHLFDDDTCACKGKKFNSWHPGYQFVVMGKLDANKITCAKCLSKLNGYVMREINKAIRDVRRKHRGKNKQAR
jgi:hypothetical protein